MPYASCPDGRIHYRWSGDPGRPPLVMIRGLSRSSRYWGPLLPPLQDHLRLLLIDNRGVGRSDAPLPPYTTEVMADDVAAVMDHAGLPRAHVFGMSMGGMIAQHVALRHPERVDRLVLGCTTPGGRHAHRPGVPARLALLRTHFGSAEGRLDRLLALMVSDAGLAAQPRVRDHWRQLSSEEPPSLRGLLGQLAAVLRHDTHARLGQIRAPTLLLTGDADQVVPPEDSHLLADGLPDAVVVTLAGARHDVTTDRPLDAADAIVRHLLDLPPRPRAPTGRSARS